MKCTKICPPILPLNPVRANSAVDNVMSQLYLLSGLYQFSLSIDEPSQEYFSALYKYVADEFSALNQTDSSHNSSEMPDKLQEALVILILSEKNEEDAGIVVHDINVVLDKLNDYLTDKNKDSIKAYCEHGLEYLLTRGVVLCSERTKKNIFLNTAEFHLFEDAHLLINQYLSFRNNANLAQISKYHYGNHHSTRSWQLKFSKEEFCFGKERSELEELFKKCPELRADKYVPCNQKGLEYLNLIRGDLGGLGLVIIRKIQNGELTIAQVVEFWEEMRDKIWTTANIHLSDPQVMEKLNLTAIQGYLLDGILTIEDVLGLTLEECQTLANEGIYKYISAGNITIKQALQLSSGGILALNTQSIQGYIDAGLLFIGDAMELTDDALWNLSDISVKNYIKIGKITIDQAIQLPEIAKYFLRSPAIQRYFEAGKMTIDQVSRLTIVTCTILNDNKFLQAAIDKDELIIEWVLEKITNTDAKKRVNWVAANKDQINLLILGYKARNFQKYVDEGKLTPEQVVQLTPDECKALNSSSIRHYIDKGRLTIDQAIKLSQDERYILKEELIRKHLDDDRLNIAQAIKITRQQLRYMKSVGVQKYIGAGILTPDRVAQLTHNGARALNSKGVQKYIDNLRLSIDQANHMPREGCNNFEDKIVQQYVDDHKLTIIQAIQLSREGRNFLNSKIAQQYINKGIRTPGQLIHLTKDGVQVMENGKLTLKKHRVQQYIDADILTQAMAAKLTGEITQLNEENACAIM